MSLIKIPSSLLLLLWLILLVKIWLLLLLLLESLILLNIKWLHSLLILLLPLELRLWLDLIWLEHLLIALLLKLGLVRLAPLISNIFGGNEVSNLKVALMWRSNCVYLLYLLLIAKKVVQISKYISNSSLLLFPFQVAWVETRYILAKNRIEDVSLIAINFNSQIPKHLKF